jgi:iodotyrosine deiodinase
MTLPRLVSAPKIDNRSDDELLRRAQEFYKMMHGRRTFRNFSDRPVPREVIEYCIRAGGTAPSGANLQPWHFVAVSDPVVKPEILIAAENEEKEFYAHRAPKAWLEALAPLGTDSNKPFLEIAPFWRTEPGRQRTTRSNRLALRQAYWSPRCIRVDWFH